MEKQQHCGQEKGFSSKEGTHTKKAMLILPVWFLTGWLAGKCSTGLCVHVYSREKLFLTRIYEATGQLTVHRF